MAIPGAVVVQNALKGKIMDGRNWLSFKYRDRRNSFNKFEVLRALSSINSEILDLESQLADARYDNFELCKQLEIRISELEEHRKDLEDQRDEIMQRHRLLRRFRLDSEEGSSRGENFDEWLKRTRPEGWEEHILRVSSSVG